MQWWEKVGDWAVDIGKTYLNYDLNRRSIQQGFPPPSDRSGGFWDFLGTSQKKDGSNVSNVPVNTGGGFFSGDGNSMMLIILIGVVAIFLLKK